MLNYEVNVKDAAGNRRSFKVEVNDVREVHGAAGPYLKNGETVASYSLIKKAKTGKALSEEVVADFLQDFGDLLANGMTDLESLKVLLELHRDAKMQAMIKRMIKGSMSGGELNEYFRAEEELLGEIAIACVTSIGKEVKTSVVLLGAAKVLYRRIKQRNKLISDLIIPFISIGIVICIFIGSMLFLIPTFKQQIGVGPEVWLMTKLIFKISDFVSSTLLIWAPAMALAIFAWIREAKFRSYCMQQLMRWKRAKAALGTLEAADFGLNLGTLIQNRVSEADALRMAALRFAGKPLAGQLRKAADLTESGSSLSNCIKQHTTVDPRIVAAITIGEKGQLDQKLLDVSEKLYVRAEREFEVMNRRIMIISSINAALMILIMWAFMFIPMRQQFQINSSASNDNPTRYSQNA